MSYSTSLKKIAASVVFAGFVSGCATGPDLGDSIAARGDQVSQTATQFKKGERLIAKGEKNVRAGNKQVSKGEGQIREGQKLQEQARAAFCQDVNYSDPACQ